ncbi:MAG: chromate transporter [Caldilineaceae bacterium]|nr:chromate transporter [Caldilineaceae bacterium]
MIEPFTYFWIFLKASLFSTGGTGNLPSIHADLLARGWAADRQFAEALAIGQISPGPSGLWVICLGYLTDGLRGALLATLAISLPPMVVLAVDALHRRVGDHPLMKGFVRGLGLAVSGIFLVVVMRLLQQNGISLSSVLIVLGSIGLGLTGRLPVPLLLVLAGVVGALLY